MQGSTLEQLRIEGGVAPGFESVQRLYEHNMRTLAEKNTQLCVYYNGEKVVDLWASTIADSDFSADSLVNVFSSGKSLEAIAMASLVDKGLLKYDARVSHYWPEFGSAGKQTLTVAELMRHEAGLAVFQTTLDPQDLLADKLKENRIGRIIEGHSQTFRKAAGSRREYHAITRGWIVNEIFRRVDPAGRTIGEFLREDISEPLLADVIIGVREVELDRISDVTPLGTGFQFKESLKPKFLRRMEHNIFQILGRIIRLLPMLRNQTTAGAPTPLKGMSRLTFFNDATFRMGETPSANAHCSARGLAKLAAMMAAGGKWAGTEYLSESAWKSMHDRPVTVAMGLSNTTFTQGGVANFSKPSEPSTQFERAFNTGREGFYGWMGLGGSIFQWHPQYNIGFGYVPTSLNVLDIVNERGKAYQAEVLRCIDKIK